jgi:hypothetical protein
VAAISAAVLAAISAYFAYRNGSPAFVITYNGAIGIIDAEKFDYEVEWENSGGRPADDFTIVSIAVSLSTSEHHQILGSSLTHVGNASSSLPAIR